jgi:predicted dehydrogenase
MKTYRVGIIGLGRMGSNMGDNDLGSPYSIAAAAAAIDRLEVVAGCDLQPEKREAFREKWGVDSVYEGFNEMLAQEELDLVAICTTASGLFKPAREAPDHDFRGDSHADLAVTVANAGVKMIFLEKAIASSARRADDVRDACHRNGTLFNTGMLRRFDPPTQAMKATIDRGLIGEPRAALQFARTSVMHMHIHSIDTLSYLVGDPGIKSIRGDLEPRNRVIENNHIHTDPYGSFQLEFANGITGASVPAGEWEFEVLGTQGAVRFAANGRTVKLRRGQEGSEWIEEKVAYEDHPSATVNCLEDLLDAHEGGRQTLGNVDISHQVTEACIGIAESHANGGAWLDLPLQNRDLYVFHI